MPIKNHEIIRDIALFTSDYQGKKPLREWLLEELDELIELTQPERSATTTTLGFASELADVRWVALTWLDVEASNFRAVELSRTVNHWIEFFRRTPIIGPNVEDHLQGLRGLVIRSIAEPPNEHNKYLMMSACCALLCAVTDIAQQLHLSSRHLSVMSRIKHAYRNEHGRARWNQLTDDQVMTLLRHS